jgi:hypothetical protein
MDRPVTAPDFFADDCDATAHPAGLLGVALQQVGALQRSVTRALAEGTPPGLAFRQAAELADASARVLAHVDRHSVAFEAWPDDDVAPVAHGDAGDCVPTETPDAVVSWTVPGPHCTVRRWSGSRTPEGLTRAELVAVVEGLMGHHHPLVAGAACAAVAGVRRG